MSVSQNKTKISFDQINKQVDKIINPERQEQKRVVDGQGILHVFSSHRDYLIYLEERDLELMGRRS